LPAGLLRTLPLFTCALILMVWGFRLIARNSILSRVQKRIFSGFLLTVACVAVLLMAFPNPGMNHNLLERVRASATKHHEIHLRWNAPGSSADPIAGYNIYRSSDGGRTFSRLNSSPDVRPDYNDRTVANGSTYIYMVKSVDKSGRESGPSNQIRLTVP
jgi:hypothetical protein